MIAQLCKFQHIHPAIGQFNPESVNLLHKPCFTIDDVLVGKFWPQRLDKH